MWENAVEEWDTGDDGFQCEATHFVIWSKTEDCGGAPEVYEIELVDFGEALRKGAGRSGILIWGLSFGILFRLAVTTEGFVDGFENSVEEDKKPL